MILFLLKLVANISFVIFKALQIQVIVFMYVEVSEIIIVIIVWSSQLILEGLEYLIIDLYINTLIHLMN